MQKKRTANAAALIALGLLATVFTMSAAGGRLQAAATACTTPNTLSGSNFEIDPNANLKVDGASPCID